METPGFFFGSWKKIYIKKKKMGDKKKFKDFLC